MTRFVKIYDAMNELEARCKIADGAPPWLIATKEAGDWFYDPAQRIPTYDVNNTPFEVNGKICCVPFLWRSSVELEEVSREKGCWQATLTYESPCGPGDERVSFSTSTKRVKSFRALSVKGGCDVATGNFLSGDQDTAGLLGEQFIDAPFMNMSITTCMDPFFLDDNCQVLNDELGNLLQTVNEADWRCWLARDVRFTGFNVTTASLITDVNAICNVKTNPEQGGSTLLTCNFEIGQRSSIICGEGENAVEIERAGQESFECQNATVLIPAIDGVQPHSVTEVPRYVWCCLRYRTADWTDLCPTATDRIEETFTVPPPSPSP